MESLAQVSAQRNAKKHKTEFLKENFDADTAWARLIGYAKTGYESITDDDKDFLLKSFGVFDRPATPGRFMLRVRIPGGQLSPLQAKALGDVAQRFGRDYIDLTTRMQAELRYLAIEDLPEVFAVLEQAGLTSWQTGVDNFRNIVIDPLDGLAADNVITTLPLLEKIQRIFLKNPEWITTLPRKFNIGINGSFSNRCNVFGQDFALALARKDGVYGFNLYLGGKVGVLAKDADLFCLPDEVLAVFIAVAELFRTYGFRDNRNKNRLKFLIEAVGMETFRHAIEEKAGRTFARGGETLCAMEGGDPYGKIVLKDGSFALYAAVPSGVFTGTAMQQAALIADCCRSGSIRLTVEQNLLLAGVPSHEIDETLTSPFFVAHPNTPSPYLANLIACAGTEHCPFGVIPNKPDAIAMAEYLAREVPLAEGKIRMYWSACPKGCGIHGAGDLGFLGTKIVRDGKTALGVDIFVGGSLSGDGEEGRLLLKGIVLDDAGQYVAELVREYRDKRLKHESFEKFFVRAGVIYSNAAVAFMMRWNRMMRQAGHDALLTLELFRKGGSHREVEEILGFGIQLVSRITGLRPYEGDEAYIGTKRPYRFDRRDVDPVFHPYLFIVEKMVESDPEKRYQVFTELYGDLQTVGAVG